MSNIIIRETSGVGPNKPAAPFFNARSRRPKGRDLNLTKEREEEGVRGTKKK